MTRSTSGRSRSIRSKRSTENNNEDDKRVFQLTPPTDGITLNDKEITEIVRSVHTSIGEGRYGTVYKFASTMGEMALKIWHKQTRVSDNDITQLINEASITQQCRSECVVQFVGYYLVPPAICIITRHCSCGTLARYYDRNGAAALPEARGLMCDLATALAHVHGLGFVHRDVKPDNCFLERDSSRLRLRLGDFGHAVEAAAADPSVRGTDGWAAPELYANKKATAKSDVYSMGLVAFFLLNGRAPHSNDRINAYLKGDSDPAWARLIVECSKHAPEKRPDSPRIKLLVGALPQLKQFPSAKYRFRLEDLGDSNTSCHQQLTQQKPKNPPSAATTVSHPKSRVMLIRKMQKTYIAQVRPFKNKEHAPQDPPPHKIMKD